MATPIHSVFILSALLLSACTETPPQPTAVAPVAEVAPTDYSGNDVEAMITGGTDATPAEALNALLEQGMNNYAIGQQRALSQLLGAEASSDQTLAIENSPDVPASLQHMADQLLMQYKQQIGVDPEARVTEPNID